MTLFQYFEKIGVKSDKVILGIDPGNTTGFSVVDFKNKKLYLLEEITYNNDKVNYNVLEKIIEKYKPDIVCFEQFRLYKNKAECQINSDFPTVKIIGALEYILEKNNMKYYSALAVEGKTFGLNIIKNCSDLKLPKSKQHRFDALAHIILQVTKHKEEI